MFCLFVDLILLKLIKRNFLLLFIGFYLSSCIDPVTPEFKILEDLILINGIASSIEGASYVTVNESVVDYGTYKTKFLPGCIVKIINNDRVIDLIETYDAYFVPKDFKVSEGETWELKVQLPDGTEYRSSPETIQEKVDVSSINSDYDLELYFDESLSRYVPGHRILISFQEPGDKENFYYYQYKSYERIFDCFTCYNGVLRNSECISTRGYRWARSYYTYLCDSPCWRIRFNEKVELFSDLFTNGKMVNDLIVGEVPLYTKQDILIDFQQYSISEEAYKYYKTLKDLLENNSGLNAPLPSPLIGNLYNPNDRDENVLGRFTVASGSSKSIFIPRRKLDGGFIEYSERSQREEYGDPVPMPLGMNDYPIYVSCDEGLYRTSFQPENWPFMIGKSEKK